VRVLWFNHRDPLHPQAGGAEVRIHEIGRRLVKSGCSVKLVCEKWKGAQPSDVLDGIEIIRIAGKYGVHLSVPFLLSISNRYDIVVDDVAHAVPWFSPLFTNKPVVGQIHHVHQEVLEFELNSSLARFVALAESSLRYFYKTLVVVSESTKHDLVTKFGIPQERIRVVPNGIDAGFYRPMRKSSEPALLWVGRVKKYKRVDHVLLAFQRVKEELPECRLFVVGDGDELEALCKFSRRLGLSDVMFTGRVNENEKLKFMASSWAIVSTSFVEGWGMTITEGSACGTPAVAYDVAGLKDSVRDGVTGSLAENGNIEDLAGKIVRILEDNGLRLRLSRNALEHAKRFSWDKTAKEFMKVLERGIDEG
jgi:glycosyltransferase involved in cell wall biosynthesis